MSEQLSGDALNRALALAAIPFGYEAPVGIDEDGAEYERLEDFVTSLDALRDGPERVLREAGGRQSHSEGRSMNFQAWEWDCPDSGINTRDGWNACEKGTMDEPVRARAALAALQAVAAPGGPAQGQEV